jgi:GT2 family glycosyltransferase
MLSVITAVHNQIEVNRLFFESLQRWTHLPFQLVIVDNQSTDGSGEFFRTKGATVIANDGNYSYPHCQNQGIEAARFDLLAFLNNDLIVAPDWDKNLVDVMERNQLDVVTSCGVERSESPWKTRYYRKKWSLVRLTVGLLGNNRRVFELMHRTMYGNWERFARRRWARFGCAVREGFVGSTVVMNRFAIEKLGPWDERIQAADFDLYLRSKVRSSERGDIRPVHVALGVFNHHFIRMTLRAGPPDFKDRANFISVDQKWGSRKTAEYLKCLR